MFYQSLTIQERYQILKESKIIQLENTDALIKWRNDMSLLSEKQFEKMLNYNKKIFSNAIERNPCKDIIELYEKSKFTQEWSNIFEEILNTNIAYQSESFLNQDKGFNYIVRHFVNYVEKKLMEKPLEIKYKKDCLNGILYQFTMKLVELGNKAMIIELNRCREANILKGNTSIDRFKNFISLFEDTNYIRSFYKKYIVLARLYTEISIWFVRNIEEMCENITNDKELIKAKFDIAEREFVLNKINIGIGDTHNFGKTVTILEFINGKKIVYKPRNLKINEAYNNLVEFLNRTRKIDILKSLKTISCESHGYEEFLEYRVCETENELHHFYIRFGELLAIAYIFNATDLHMENIIAYGEYPVLIDLETFIQQPNTFSDEKINQKLKYEFDSVKRTLLLESRLRGDERGEGVDISAINGEGYVLDDILIPVDMFTDMARYEKQKIRVNGAKNLPFSDKHSKNIKKYVNDILRGFKNIYEIFLESRDKGILEDIINQFSDIPVRHLIRNTDQYDTILRHSMHPDHLQDMLDREKILENMWSNSSYDGNVVISEINGMRRNDIPFFYRYTTSKDLFNDMNCKLENYFLNDSYTELKTHIAGLCEKNKQRQESFIHLALDYRDLISSGKCCNAKRKFGNINLKNQDYISDYLKNVKENMIKIGDEYSLFAPVLNAYGKWTYDLVENDLYDGIGGMALIEHYFGKNDMLEKIVLASMKILPESDMKEFYLNQKNVGYSSPYSILHMLSFAKKEYVNQTTTTEIINWFYEILDSLIYKEIGNDYINGALSIVESLLRLYEKNMRIENKMLAIKYMEKAIEQHKFFDGYGIAHGLMGLTMMLYKMWNVTGIEKYLALGEQNLGLIKSHYNDIDSLSWCRGKVGVAMGLLEIYKIMNRSSKNNIVPQMIEKIHIDICNSSYMVNDCLCHGNLAICDYFIYRYQIFGNKEDLRIAEKIVDMVKTRMTFRSLPEVSCFGLFTGEGGLAYEILRLNKFEEVPTLLC